MDRRTFLGTAALLLANARATARTPVPLGLQLYTVMPLLEQDFDGTLGLVAKIGYREVETIGAFGRDPAAVRDLLDKHGLRSPSQHLLPGALYDVFNKLTRKELTFDEASRIWRQEMALERVEPVLHESILRARALGQKYIVWQILWPQQMQTRVDLEKFCRALNKAGELCAREGHVLNFHNHAAEFEARDGIVPYDFILANTDPRWVKLEIDLYWAVKAGVDPIQYFRRHAGRYRQCHLKDGTAGGEITVVGEGIMKFQPLIEAARAAGVEHYYVEQDGAADPLKASRQAYDYLRRIT
jgi:sugar phosphate isomerase/epimerase